MLKCKHGHPLTRTESMILCNLPAKEYARLANSEGCIVAENYATLYCTAQALESCIPVPTIADVKAWVCAMGLQNEMEVSK